MAAIASEVATDADPTSIGLPDVTGMLIDVVNERAAACFQATFDHPGDEYLKAARRVTAYALRRISDSDALYHNVEHTVHVTVVGLEILRGKQYIDRDVSRGDWLNMVVALLCHDIGYVRGIVPGDENDSVSAGRSDETLATRPGMSDAVLMPVHVDRGKSFVADTFSADKLVDVDTVQQNIERTRFPVPDDPQYQQTADYPGLVRGADLVGQLSDRRYLRKLAAVYFEFEEIGFNENTGYRNPGDLLTNYPSFYAARVAPYVQESLAYLSATAAGRDIIGLLNANLDNARRPS